MSKKKARVRKTWPHRMHFDRIMRRFVGKPRLEVDNIPSQDGATGLTHGISDELFTRMLKQRLGLLGQKSKQLYLCDHQIGLWRKLEKEQICAEARLILGEHGSRQRIENAFIMLHWDYEIIQNELTPKQRFINFQNGMFDIQSRVLKPHDPKYHSTCQLPYDYEPDAKCPLWIETLKQIFSDEHQKIQMLQQWFGYCLTPATYLQAFMIFIGVGANGKSLIIEVLCSIVGRENCAAVSIDKMWRDALLVALIDKLVNAGAEIDTSRPLKASTLKMLTGDDELTVDVKYRPAITFRPTAKHVFAVNEMIRFRDHSPAIIRRALFLEFAQEFSGKNRDTNLARKLAEEKTGILNWALEGLTELEEKKEIYRPPSSRRLEELFAERLNPIIQFIKKECILSKDARVPRKALYTRYEVWCEKIDNSLTGGSTRFYRMLRQTLPSIRDVKVQGVDYFKGIRFRLPRKRKSGGKRGKS